MQLSNCRSISTTSKLQIVKSTNKLIWPKFCKIVSSLSGIGNPVSHKKSFDTLNNSLKGIRSSKSVMGSVTVFLAGDFRQILPVIPKETRANEVQACINA